MGATGILGGEMGKANQGIFVLFCILLPASTYAQTYDLNKGALSQPAILLGNTMATGDRIIHSSEAETIFVLSGSIEEKDPDIRVAGCVLTKLGLALPKSLNGVYWARWNNRISSDLLAATTTRWKSIGGAKRHYTFIHHDFQAARYSRQDEFIEFMITLYHEIKGHNIDDVDHDDPKSLREFEKRYETPVRRATEKTSVLQLRAQCMNF